MHSKNDLAQDFCKSFPPEHVDARNDWNVCTVDDNVVAFTNCEAALNQLVYNANYSLNSWKLHVAIQLSVQWLSRYKKYLKYGVCTVAFLDNMYAYKRYKFKLAYYGVK